MRSADTRFKISQPIEGGEREPDRHLRMQREFLLFGRPSGGYPCERPNWDGPEAEPTRSANQIATVGTILVRRVYPANAGDLEALVEILHELLFESGIGARDLSAAAAESRCISDQPE